MRRTLLFFLVLAGLTWATYSPSLRNGFVALDDNDYIVLNPVVQKGFTLQSVGWAFTTDHSANWHPLTWLSHLLDVELFGLIPAGHHAMSLAFHAANACLLFLLIRGLTGMLWGGALVAALFAVHPLHVESVAWAAERKDLLSMFFALAAMIAYLRPLRRSGAPRMWLAPLLFALSLMAKQMMITLPFLLLLLDWWPLGRWEPGGGKSPRRGRSWRALLPPAALWREKSALFLLMLGASALTYRVHDIGGAVAMHIPLLHRLATALSAYRVYLVKTLWPSGLAAFYPYPTMTPAFAAVAVSSLVLLTGLTVLAVRGARVRPYLTVGWFWYLGSLVPVIGIVQIGAQAMADRYTYWPLTGLFLALAFGLFRAWPRSPRLRIASVVLATAAILLLSGLAHRQLRHWKDVRALAERILTFSPDSDVALNGLAIALAAEGKSDEALAVLKRVVAINPLQDDARGNLASLLLAKGQVAEAEEQLEAILKIHPGSAKAHLELGTLLTAQGRAAAAIPHLELVVSLDPFNTAARNNLGSALLAQGMFMEARAQYEEVLRRDPQNGLARLNLSVVLLALGRVQDSREQYRAVLSTASGLTAANLETLLDLGVALVEKGLMEDGIHVLERAVQIDPAAQDARNNLGAALASAGRLTEAAEVFRAAVALNDRYLDARLNLGQILVETGQIEEGIRHLLAAAMIEPTDERVRKALAQAVRKDGGAALRRVLDQDPKLKDAVPGTLEAGRPGAEQ